MKLGDRMKGYESVCEQVLPSRLPVVLRLDGNSFSKLTKTQDFEKPFDSRFESAMDAAALSVLEYCSGAQFAFVQSDEISILLRNSMTPKTQPFLANRTQKLTSLTAAKASVAFNAETANHGMDTSAVFDCRAFVVPVTEVNNYFLWRQYDCFKNCVSSYAYHGLRKKYGRKTAQKMLHGKSTNERQELIFQELDTNINDLDVHRKRGRVFYHSTYEVPLRETLDPAKLDELIEKGHIDDPDQRVQRGSWGIDPHTPRFDKHPAFLNSYLDDLSYSFDP